MAETHDTLFKKVWFPLIWLTVVTALEFVVAFSMDPGPVRVAIFVGMTIIKAFFIVAYFMHMRYEFSLLRWSIIGPTIVLIIYLVFILLYEGSMIGYLKETLGGITG